jgi:hypothetical protein
LGGIGLLTVHEVNEDRDGSLAGTGVSGERWWGSPRGDIVQKLKDVIWKVGEQRRLRERGQWQEEEDGEPEAEKAGAEAEAEAAEAVWQRQVNEKQQQQVGALAQVNAAVVMANAATVAMQGDVFTSRSVSPPLPSL